MNHNAEAVSRHRTPALAGIANVLQLIFQRGMDLISDAGLLSRLAAASTPGEFEQALETLRQRFEPELDDIVRRWLEQTAATLLSWQGLITAVGAGLDPRANPPAQPLGPLQHKRRQLDAGNAALAALRDAQLEFAGQLRLIAGNAIAGFGAALQSQDDRELGLRELFDLWLEASEAAFEPVLHSDDYSASLGRLVNAAADALRVLQRVRDEALEALRLPSPRELAAMQQRMQQLRREQRAMQQALADAQAWRQELTELRAELARLRGTGRARRRRPRREGSRAD